MERFRRKKEEENFQSKLKKQMKQTYLKRKKEIEINKKIQY